MQLQMIDTRSRLKQFPLLVPVMSLLPPWIIDRVFPLLNSLKAVRKAMFQFVQGFLEQYQRGDQKSSHVTVFHTILADPDLPASEKTPDRLAWEAQLFLGAGTLTTAHFLLSTTYHVLANPPVLEKLLNELDTEVAKHGMPLSWQTLEHLPYLNAVINEGLRISYSIMGRLTRVHPDTTLSFNNWTIPPGTPVSMSSPLIHNDTTLFPNSYVFDPNRWLGTPEQTQYLEQYLFNFGKGTRMCAGTNLAYAEFYLALAAVFGRFGRELVLWDTERERDVDPVRDYFNACPGKDSRGVRVIVGEKKG